MNLDAETARRLAAWSSDESQKPAIDALTSSGQWDEIRDAFGAELTFGTAGLRGKMGVGPNRMNARVVSVATAAVAAYVKALGAASRGVVVSHDTRLHSEAFAERTRDILAANGVRVFFFEGDRPVPELSFAIRETNAIAGVMITASHNPRAYNGYKVSWEHGGQIGQEIASAILERMQAIDPLSIATSPAKAEIAILGAPMDGRYLDRIDAHVLDRAALPDLEVVYDPLFGCGRRLVPPALLRAGVRSENLHVVEAHAQAPEGHALGEFVGLESPNPASPGVLDLAIARAKDLGADIVLSTDPDSDRLVAAIPIAGVWARLHANETWPVLLDDRLKKLKAKGLLSKDGVVVRSWVTTQLIDKVAADYGIRTIEVPTGFKWIAEQMLVHDVLAGFEESDGMSVGSHTREKDAQLAAVLVAETAAEAKAQGKTLADLRDALYRKHGRHEAIVTDLTFEGVEGRRSIAKIRDLLANRPELIFDRGGAIEQKYDGARAKMPDGTMVTVRPSGTEPKVKVYVEKVGRGDETERDAHRLLDEVADRIRDEAR